MNVTNHSPASKKSANNAVSNEEWNTTNHIRKKIKASKRNSTDSREILMTIINRSDRNKLITSYKTSSYFKTNRIISVWRKSTVLKVKKKQKNNSTNTY